MRSSAAVNPLPYKEVVYDTGRHKGQGQYVGTYMAWGVNNSGWWGEGEIKFYIDGDREFPTICGTGTEDYFCGSYDFDNKSTGQYQEFTTPYAGLVQALRPDGHYRSQQRFGMYRWHIMDPIRFSSRPKGDDTGAGLARGRKVPAPAGRYLVRCLLVSNVPGRSVPTTAGQGLFGDNMIKSGDHPPPVLCRAFPQEIVVPPERRKICLGDLVQRYARAAGFRSRLVPFALLVSQHQGIGRAHP